MYNKVEICGVNTSKIKVLSETEQKALLKRCREGDTEAREALINGNLRLVLSVIQSFKNRNENLDDLFQVGCIGLIKAINNFDPSQEVKLSTYAVPMTVECRAHFIVVHYVAILYCFPNNSLILNAHLFLRFYVRQYDQ